MLTNADKLLVFCGMTNVTKGKKRLISLFCGKTWTKVETCEQNLLNVDKLGK
jgi:hypothetical protein